jgi:hypothetical protein
MDFRSITLEEYEDARQVARDIIKIKQYEISMKLRKNVENLFAHLKSILGLGRLRLRGPCGAIDKFYLAASAQNLCKSAKIFPATQKPRAACTGRPANCRSVFDFCNSNSSFFDGISSKALSKSLI